MNPKTLVKIILYGGLLGGLLFVVFNFQAISDWARLRNYQPPARVVKLADDTTMTGQTRRLFYVNHPDIGDKQKFNSHCRSTAEQTIVLGCYISNQGIFLLDVKEQRLNGVVEVTAAHEVLHAAYERLSDEEKSRVDKLIGQYFDQIKNQRIIDTVENYRAKDPSIVPNELHSILGTEVAELSPELEEYYGRYFADRKKLVAYSEQYEQTFVRLRQQVADYDAQLDQLQKQINANQSSIQALGGELDSDRANLDQLLASGQNDEYNASVPGYNAKVGEYNRLVNSTKQLIGTYNAIVEKRNQLATVEQELVEAIDSSKLTTEETQ